MRGERIVLTIFLLIFAGLSFAQQGYVVAGFSDSFTHGLRDFFVIKLDPAGNKEWGKNYGGTNEDSGESIYQTSDFGYVVAGCSYSFTNGGYDFLIYKLYVNGGKQWRRHFGGAEDDWGQSVQQTSDGGYVVAGHTQSYTHGIGDSDFLVYKLDGTGNEQWNRNLGGTYGDRAYSVQQTTDGGYVVAGVTQSYTHGTPGSDHDFLVYKLHPDGSKAWRKNLGGDGYDHGRSIQQTSDGGYVVAGKTVSFTHGSEDFLIYKLRPDGGKAWRKNLGGTQADEAHSIREIAGGGYVVAGTTMSYTRGIDDTDFLIYRLDPDGNKLWRKNLGGTGDDRCYSIRQAYDGSLVAAGSYSPHVYGTGETRFRIFKLDTSGNKLWRRDFGGEQSDAAKSIQPTVN